LIRRRQLNSRKLTWAELQTFGAQPPNPSKPSLPTNLFNVSAFWEKEIIGEGTIYQLHSSFESLVRDAEFINYPFQEWVGSWLTGGPHTDKIKKHLHHGPGGVDTAFVNLSKSGSVARVKLEEALYYVLVEDVPDPSKPEAPLIASAGDTLAKDPLIASAGDTLAKELLEKLRSAGVKEIYVASSIDASLGTHKRGPLKHVDRAIAKVLCRNTFQLHRIQLFPAVLPLLRRQFQASD
jgi:hypothetical protein